MERKTGKRGQLMGGLFTMLLFLVFILSALFTVLTGSRVYENITARSDKNFSSSTALSYIANKVRQGDRAGMTDIKEIEGTQVLELRQQIGGWTAVSGSFLLIPAAALDWRMVWKFWNVKDCLFPEREMFSISVRKGRTGELCLFLLEAAVWLKILFLVSRKAGG